MAPSFDCVSSLLCTEDNIIFDDNDYESTVGMPDNSWRQTSHRLHNPSLFFDDSTGWPLQSDECLAIMVEKECQHMPAGDYLNKLRTGVLDSGARKEAIDWIEKVRAHFRFGPLCAYLSINYMDRFLSLYELPKGKSWSMQLLAVACLSLAAKLEENEVPLCVDLQVAESKFIFEARTIKRMELLILSTLKWRMQAISPFSFIDHFLNKINEDQTPLRSSASTSIQLILNIVRGIDSLEFKPSEIAAAVAIFIAGEAQAADAEKAVSVLAQHVEKERVLKCFEVVQELSSNSSTSSSSGASVPRSPIGVLDAACLSYKSDEIDGSCSSSSHNNSPDAKRRKLNKT
ncbi:cyclin-D4-1-like isoform X1 [Neltuma alba]|uniref:cyclin-D4-1-like isoform X1 n=1 Tax=Neltuma alba TaxID=207710 RepID=UPI0010A55F60|nr:cyclin-D4-1-like isoform X1 [Prosopis alba]